MIPNLQHRNGKNIFHIPGNNLHNPDVFSILVPVLPNRHSMCLNPKCRTTDRANQLSLARRDIKTLGTDAGSLLGWVKLQPRTGSPRDFMPLDLSEILTNGMQALERTEYPHSRDSRFRSSTPEWSVQKLPTIGSLRNRADYQRSVHELWPSFEEEGPQPDALRSPKSLCRGTTTSTKIPCYTRHPCKGLLRDVT